MYLTHRKMLRAKEVAEIFEISVSYAYKIIEQLNKELTNAGYLTIQGKVDSHYLYQRYFPEVNHIAMTVEKGENNAPV